MKTTPEINITLSFQTSRILLSSKYIPRLVPKVYTRFVQLFNDIVIFDIETDTFGQYFLAREQTAKLVKGRRRDDT